MGFSDVEDERREEPGDPTVSFASNNGVAPPGEGRGWGGAGSTAPRLGLGV